jgi:hypothetical protein
MLWISDFRELVHVLTLHQKYRVSLRIAVSAIRRRSTAWTMLIQENQQEVMNDIWHIKCVQVITQTTNQAYPHHPFPVSIHKHHRTSRWLTPTLRIYLHFKIRQLTGWGTKNEKQRKNIRRTIPHQRWSKQRNKIYVFPNVILTMFSYNLGSQIYKDF